MTVSPTASPTSSDGLPLLLLLLFCHRCNLVRRHPLACPPHLLPHLLGPQQHEHLEPEEGHQPPLHRQHECQPHEQRPDTHRDPDHNFQSSQVLEHQPLVQTEVLREREVRIADRFLELLTCGRMLFRRIAHRCCLDCVEGFATLRHTQPSITPHAPVESKVRGGTAVE